MGEPGPMCWGMEISWSIGKDWVGDINEHICSRKDSRSHVLGEGW